MTVFQGVTHIDNFDKYYGLISQMLLDPGFRQDDFNRLKTDSVNYLKVSLRESNDEELGKEYLYNLIYAGHPYEHNNMGTVSSLEKLTLADVQAFYKAHYTRANMVLGSGRGLSAGFSGQGERGLCEAAGGNRCQCELCRSETCSGDAHLDHST